MKTLWLSDEPPQSYVAAQHRKRAWNFLYFDLPNDGPVLICGDGSNRTASHRGLLLRAQSLGLKVHEMWVRGAGSCRFSKITEWKSAGFKVTTPENLRPALKKSLQMDG